MLISRQAASTPTLRLTDAAVSWNYNGVTQARGFVRDAIKAMKTFNPDSSALIGELYMELAFFEMTMADNYCNGIPLGHTEDGVRTNGAPPDDRPVYDSASAHLDTALTFSAKATDAGSVYINRAARVWKARVLSRRQGERSCGCCRRCFGPNDVRLRYDLLVGQRLERHVDVEQLDCPYRCCRQLRHHRWCGQHDQERAAIRFVERSARAGREWRSSDAEDSTEDGVTRPFYLSQLYKGQFDPLVLASGVDARLLRGRGEASGE
jgi:hypothetical protein